MTRLRIVSFLAVVLVASRAGAQEDPRKAQAEALFQEALKLHDHDQEAQALEKYQRSYAIYPSPNTLLNLARSEQLVGKSLASLRHYREALKNPLLNPKGVSLAKQFIAELEARVGRVELRGPKGLVVTIAGTPAEYVLPVAEPLDLEPGTVLASGALGKERYEGKGLAVAGKSIVVDLAPVAPAAPLPAAAAGGAPEVEAPPPVLRDESYWTTRRVVGVSAFAVGAGAVVTGVVFLSASSRNSDRADTLRAGNPSGCAGIDSATCSDIRDASDSQHRDSAAGWVFVASGAAVAVGGAALFLWPKSASSAGAGAGGVRVVPRLGGLDVLGSF